MKGLHCNIIQNANPQQVFSKRAYMYFNLKMQYTTPWEISPWTIQSRREELNITSFDTWVGYFWVWDENCGQKNKNNITCTLHLHVDLDNKQVHHLRVMLHISSSIPCLLSWNFSSEDNPDNIDREINKYCKSVTSLHCF